jgi:hypothetical protein
MDGSSGSFTHCERDPFVWGCVAHHPVQYFNLIVCLFSGRKANESAAIVEKTVRFAARAAGDVVIGHLFCAIQKQARALSAILGKSKSPRHACGEKCQGLLPGEQTVLKGKTRWGTCERIVANFCAKKTPDAFMAWQLSGLFGPLTLLCATELGAVRLKTAPVAHFLTSTWE